jgi:hypothetical protein
MNIPTFTEKEDVYYNQLLTKVCQEISVDKKSPSFNKNDERSRLIYYFISTKMQKNKKESISFIENGIQNWIKNNENEYWITSWNNVLNEIKQDNWSILYEISDKMQQLRSKKPFRKVFIDDKLRYKIINFVSKK